MSPTVADPVMELFEAHRDLAIRLSRRFRFPGGDRDDAAQEALLQLFLTARQVVASGRVENDGYPFRALAIYSIRVHLSRVCDRARTKHSISLGAERTHVFDEGEEVPMVDVLPAGDHGNPHMALVHGEELDALMSAWRTLTPGEMDAVRDYVNDAPGRSRNSSAASSGLRKLRDAAGLPPVDPHRRREERLRKVAELRERGLGSKRIAAILGVGSTTVERDFARLSYRTTTERRASRIGERLALVETLRKRGCSIPEIVQMTHSSKATVVRDLRRLRSPLMDRAALTVA